MPRIEVADVTDRIPDDVQDQMDRVKDRVKDQVKDTAVVALDAVRARAGTVGEGLGAKLSTAADSAGKQGKDVGKRAQDLAREWPRRPRGAPRHRR